MKKITVADLIQASPREIALKAVAGTKGLKTRALLPEVQKVGLALTGYFDNIDTRKIQVLGKTEISYLRKLSPAKRQELIRALFERKAAGYLVTAGKRPPREMYEEADRLGVPLLTSPLETIKCIRVIIRLIEELAASEQHLHGVLVDIMGVGVFIMGPSGIGKSECALELVVRGHRLVADDIVVVKRHADGRVVGSGTELLRYLVEVRGLGIVNVKDLFGISAIKSKKTIDMVVELVRWNEKESYERLGLEQKTYKIAGMDLPYMKMPVTPGRNIAVIVEVAARNQALKAQGTDAAFILDRMLAGKLAEGRG